MNNTKHMHKDVVITRNNDGELVVTSRQVAEDFEKNHKEVLRAIEVYKTRISTAQFCALFIESQYRASNGKMNKEYLLTRDGFSFLVMGFTGAKADEWKLKYIEAFNKMEQALREPIKQLSPMELMELQFKVIKEQEQKIIAIDKKINSLEWDMPLFNVECDELQKVLKKKGVEVLGGYRSPAYNDRSLRAKVYVDIQGQIRREFGLSSYKAIKRKNIDLAKEIINNYTAPIYLVNEIYLLNQQLTDEDYAV